jgi:nucleotide-binding universal stress UspA family protein
MQPFALRERVMSYARVMVPVDLGPYAADRIALAGSLADQFDSLLIGTAAQRPFIPAYGEGAGADAALIESEQRRVDEDLVDVERVFRTACGNRNRIEWRGSSSHEATFFATEQARAADILVLTRQGSGDETDWRFGVDPGTVVMQVGRPMMLAPPGVRSLSGKRVLIAWKDTREARRAVWDALPLLQRAETVFIVAVSENARKAGALDVAEYLASHAIRARTLLREGRHATASEELLAVAEKEGIDLLVAGAYGHARVREWIFGGVSRDLLDRTPVACLMSH